MAQTTLLPSTEIGIPISGPPSSRLRSEKLLVLLVGGVQFVNILDFMMVMPLGPDFAAALGIPMSRLGLIGGSYTAAAALSGILGATFLDRFDRRVALGLTLLGLVVATAWGGMATGLGSLVAARIAAGCFGGPATSLALAIVADVVPIQRRGRALGTVMTAFSVASVAGVPVGLELARLWGWRAPFFGVAGLGLVVASAAIALMPPMRSHIRERSGLKRSPRLELAPNTLLSLSSTAFVMLGIFAVVPNLSAYVQYNLGLPRSEIGTLYFAGGIASFLATKLMGQLVDKFGSSRLVLVGTLLHAGVLLALFVAPVAGVPVMVLFVAFMVSGSFRMVPMQTLASRVPLPEKRARFMSAQSAVQHSASALGAMGGAALLVARPDGHLDGMTQIALLAILSAGLVVPAVFALERRLNPER